MSIEQKNLEMRLAIDEMGVRVRNKRIKALEYITELSGPKDFTFYMNGTDLESGVRTSEPCRTQYFVNTDAELDQAKSTTENFSEVFNTWKRFSHRLGFPQPASTEELNTWQLTPEGKIFNSTNSTTFLGFVSPNAYTDYNFIANLSSTANDDDYIGLVCGFAEVDGHQNTLTALRTSGSSRLWNIAYNFNQGPIATYSNGYKTFLYGNFELEFADGVVDPNRPSSTTNNQYGSWTNVPYGCRVGIQRVGDVFTFKTTDWSRDGSPMPWNESATFTLDLNSDPLLAKFKGSSPIGYVSQSQANSTWDVIQRPATKKDIVDVRNDDVWRWLNNSWVNIGKLNTVNDFGFGSYVFSPINSKVYYVGYDRKIYNIK